MSSASGRAAHHVIDHTPINYWDTARCGDDQRAGDFPTRALPWTAWRRRNPLDAGWDDSACSDVIQGLVTLERLGKISAFRGVPPLVRALRAARHARVRCARATHAVRGSAPRARNAEHRDKDGRIRLARPNPGAKERY